MGEAVAARAAADPETATDPETASHLGVPETAPDSIETAPGPARGTHQGV